MEIVRSKNGVPIRLTQQRWLHITEEHSEMAGYYFTQVKEKVQCNQNWGMEGPSSFVKI